MTLSFAILLGWH